MTVVMLLSCGQTKEEADCTRMITCTLVDCEGVVVGHVNIEACQTDQFVNGCCPHLNEVKCNCPAI